MKVLVIGGGGREHALAWKIAQSAKVESVYAAPGNPGIARLVKGRCVPIGVMDFEGIRRFVESESITLVVVGPEDPLAAGIVDTLGGICKIFGPSRAAAQLEASKGFAKAFMARHGIPTAAYAEFCDPDAAAAYVRERGAPVVIKADGLAAGKGVTVARDTETALRAIDDAMRDAVFGPAGAKIVVEEFMEGEETSVLAFADGATVVPMAPSQDHKAVFDGDLGPNTGGMGAYSPTPLVTPELMEEIERRVLRPCVEGMAAEGMPYRGCLYAGLMISAEGPKVVEFNVRFGDPETQVVLPRMRGDLVPVLEACCAGRLSDVPVEFSGDPCVSVVMASGGYPGSYAKDKAITGVDDAGEDPSVQVFHAGTKERDGVLLTNGGRVLNVTATSADLRSAIENAYRAVEKIHFEGAQFRRDIGHKALRRMERGG